MYRKMIGLTAAVAMAANVMGFGTAAVAADTIKIGDINSYKRLPGHTIPYKNGAVLAVETINAAGGVLGKQLELISRDDQGKPGEAIKIAEELFTSDEVGHDLTGTHLQPCRPGASRPMPGRRRATSVSGGRAACRCAGLGQGQQIYVPAARLRPIMQGLDAGRRSPPRTPRNVMPPSRRTMPTARMRSRPSRPRFWPCVRMSNS